MSAGLALPLTCCWREYAPVRVSRSVTVKPFAGEVGEPAAVQLGFDDHGLGKLGARVPESHCDRPVGLLASSIQPPFSSSSNPHRSQRSIGCFSQGLDPADRGRTTGPPRLNRYIRLKLY
jgi:hypothetical protein